MIIAVSSVANVSFSIKLRINAKLIILYVMILIRQERMYKLLSGYSLINNNCVLAHNNQDTYCQIYDSDNNCRLCTSGYSLNNTKCSKIPIDFCISYDFRSQACLKCQATYILQKNECIFPAISDENCVFYENSYCKTCK